MPRAGSELTNSEYKLNCVCGLRKPSKVSEDTVTVGSSACGKTMPALSRSPLTRELNRDPEPLGDHEQGSAAALDHGHYINVTISQVACVPHTSNPC